MIDSHWTPLDHFGLHAWAWVIITECTSHYRLAIEAMSTWCTHTCAFTHDMHRQSNRLQWRLRVGATGASVPPPPPLHFLPRSFWPILSQLCGIRSIFVPTWNSVIQWWIQGPTTSENTVCNFEPPHFSVFSATPDLTHALLRSANDLPYSVFLCKVVAPV